MQAGKNLVLWVNAKGSGYSLVVDIGLLPQCYPSIARLRCARRLIATGKTAATGDRSGEGEQRAFRAWTRFLLLIAFTVLMPQAAARQQKQQHTHQPLNMRSAALELLRMRRRRHG